ncbi:MAG: outer membrane beta-barrel protein [Saprospiraceae bacterium]|nr:outer membrane beta-barrel protein [Saprospiraceae bacterium]
MKKMTIHMYMLLFMGCSTAIFSQTDISLFGGNYSSGTKSTMIGSEFIQLDPIHSFAGGLIVKQYLSDQLAFRSGLTYQKRGFAMTEGTSVNVFGLDIPLGVEIRNEIHYLEVPLMLEYKIPITGRVQP